MCVCEGRGVNVSGWLGVFVGGSANRGWLCQPLGDKDFRVATITMVVTM